jgi:Calx-beta domain-containing protein
LQVARTGNSQVASSVDYVTANFTASAADYQATTGTLTWAPNDTSVKLITVTLTPDAVDESDETFTVTLRDASSGTELDVATATVTIADDDVLPPSPPPSSGGGNGGGGGGTQNVLALLIYAMLLSWRRVSRQG